MIPPFAPKPVAWHSEQADTVRINMAVVYGSIERTHGLNIKASHTGFEVTKGRTMEYRDGFYTCTQAKGKEQCATYRLKMLKFLHWALVNAPTPELNEYKDWINGQFK